MQSTLNGTVMTEQSVIYRRRASVLAKQAEAETDFEKMGKLLAEALSWIQLAENDELLTQAEREQDSSPC